MERVFLARCRTYEGDEVFPAISDLLRDMSFEIPPHQTVFIKPNVMSQNRPNQHTVTHFSLIEALCILFAEKNCKIRIGDSIAFYQRGLTRRAFDTTGLRAVAEKYGAEMVALDEEPLIKIRECTTVLKEIYLPEKILDASMVINVCKLKTHAGLRLSGAIKNIFGILPGGYKQRIHMWTKNDFELSDVFIDLINLVKPSLHIMDAIVALDGGPSAIGKPVPLKMILASKNPAALDVVAARMIGYEPTDISTLIRAQERGMIDDFNDIVIRKGQQSVKADDDDFPVLRFKKLIRGPLEMSRGKAGLFVTDTFVEPVIRRTKCSRCGECIDFCSPGAISTDDGLFPFIDREKCINCYCCISACSADAIGIRSSIKNKVIRMGRLLLRI